MRGGGGLDGRGGAEMEKKMSKIIPQFLCFNEM